MQETILNLGWQFEQVHDLGNPRSGKPFSGRDFGIIELGIGSSWFLHTRANSKGWRHRSVVLASFFFSEVIRF